MAELRLTRAVARPSRAAPPGNGPRVSGRRARFAVAATVVCAVAVCAVAVAASACRASEAGPGSGLVPPSGWQPLPALATAAMDAAKGAGLQLDGVEAWGETARGCYAAWLALRGASGAPDVMADQVVTSLSAEPALAGIVVRDVIEPAAGAKTGVLSLTFQRALYHGKLRATLASDGRVEALACFWNQREPVACEQGCATLFGSTR